MKAPGCIHREITEPKLLSNPDPVGMWDALLARFTKKDAGALLSAHKKDDENWDQFIHRVESNCYAFKRLVPANWNLIDLYGEIKMFVILNELPTSHSLRSTLLVDANLSYDTVTNGIRRFITTSSLPSETAASAQGTGYSCHFCKNRGHSFLDCAWMKAYQNRYFEDRRNGALPQVNFGNRGSGRGGYRNRGRGGAQAQANVANTVDNRQQESELTEEFAGNASALTPLLQTDADYWTADSGASIYMTFRRDWIIGLVPD